MQNSVNFFKNEYDKFSNMYPVNVEYEKVTYPTVEHAYVAAKTTDVQKRSEILKFPAEEARKVKGFGRTLILRPNWDLMKISIMRKLLEQKFSQDEFKELLLRTENKSIEEGNFWHDNFWGNCYCQKCKNKKGENILGKLLMDIRESLK